MLRNGFRLSAWHPSINAAIRKQIQPDCQATHSLCLFNNRYQQFSTKRPAAQLASDAVTVNFDDGKSSKFLNFWLRDHCRCEDCWHAQTKQRLVDTLSLPMDIKAEKSVIDGQVLRLTWPDGHQSVYNLEWLRRHSYWPPLGDNGSSESADNNKSLSDAKVLWNSQKIQSVQPPLVVDYKEIMENDGALLRWLQLVDKYGFCEVDGCPPSAEHTERLVNRISFIRETHYGRFWDFSANMAHGDTAYTALAIGAHTDTTYFTDPIGLQLFHLLRHDGQGGETLLIDGFFVAKIMQTQYPQHYRTLCQTRIACHSAGDQSVIMSPTPDEGYPILNVDAGAELYQVRYNNHDRSVLSGKRMKSAESIRKFYEALRVWQSLLSDKRNEYWHRMRPGRPLIVDNWRVLHGRSAFTGYRRLCGAYINWDDYQSRVKILQSTHSSLKIDNSI